MPKKNATSKIPAYLSTATLLYGDSLGAKRAKDLLDAMQTYAELPDNEQRFVLAHLAYLNIESQAAHQRVLTQIRDLLDELAEQVSVALDATLPPEEPPPADPEDGPPVPPADAAAITDAVVVTDEDGGAV